MPFRYRKRMSKNERVVSRDTKYVLSNCQNERTEQEEKGRDISFFIDLEFYEIFLLHLYTKTIKEFKENCF